MNIILLIFVLLFSGFTWADKPFGFTPTYITGSPLSHFQDSQTLVAVFPKNIFGPEESGYNFGSKLNPSNFKKITYEVMFSKEFDFVKGGKLPGLCGGAGATGGDKANGKNGFSARVMWRKNGRIVSYVYHVDQNDLSWAPKKTQTLFVRNLTVE